MGDDVKQQKRWFLRVELAVLVCVVCIWVVKSVTIDIDNTKASVLKQQEYELQNCDMELANLDEYARKKRQNIEAWYAENLANLKQWERECLEQLDREEKIAWARYNQNVKATTSNKSGATQMNSYGTASTYMMIDKYAMTNSHKVTDGLHSQTTNTYVVGNPAGIYESEMLRIKNSKDAIKSEFLKLQRKKECYLASLESNVKGRTWGINAKKKRNVQKNTRVKPQGGPGLIEAISTDANGESLIMIEGEIFHEGDLVKGFKIKKIFGQTVEFQKDGRIWVQHMD